MSHFRSVHRGAYFAQIRTTTGESHAWSAAVPCSSLLGPRRDGGVTLRSPLLDCSAQALARVLGLHVPGPHPRRCALRSPHAPHGHLHRRQHWPAREPLRRSSRRRARLHAFAQHPHPRRFAFAGSGRRPRCRHQGPPVPGNAARRARALAASPARVPHRHGRRSRRGIPRIRRRPGRRGQATVRYCISLTSSRFVARLGAPTSAATGT